MTEILAKSARSLHYLYLPAPTWLQDELGLINDHVTAQALIDEALQGRSAGQHALFVDELPEASETGLCEKGIGSSDRPCFRQLDLKIAFFARSTVTGNIFTFCGDTTDCSAQTRAQKRN